MSIQDIFYLLGSIMMSLMIVLLLVTTVLFIFVIKKVSEMQKTIERKLDEITMIVSHPGEIAGILMQGAIKGIQKVTSKRNKG